MTSPSCCPWSTASSRCQQGRQAAPARRATDRRPRLYVASWGDAASSRSSPGATPDTAPAWGSCAGSLNGPSPGLHFFRRLRLRCERLPELNKALMHLACATYTRCETGSQPHRGPASPERVTGAASRLALAPSKGNIRSRPTTKLLFQESTPIQEASIQSNDPAFWSRRVSAGQPRQAAVWIRR